MNAERYIKGKAIVFLGRKNILHIKLWFCVLSELIALHGHVESRICGAFKRPRDHGYFESYFIVFHVHSPNVAPVITQTKSIAKTGIP
mmetsp:Transcript_8270/g.17204  ORF Transcript_8270/g.17204 Transcript_8270/m.17204 type:complete len:88 (-) Transcript_8270:740-1003(-)